MTDLELIAAALRKHQRAEYGQHDGWWECTCMSQGFGPADMHAPVQPFTPEHQAQVVLDALSAAAQACPACGSSEHDGWTNNADCPEDWSVIQRDSFEHRRWLQIANERAIAAALAQTETDEERGDQ